MNKKYKVPVSWRVYGDAIVEAESPEEAAREADMCDVEDDPRYVMNSFYVVDPQEIEEVNQ